MNIELSRNGFLFLSNEQGLLQIPLGDILSVYYKSTETPNDIKGCFIQFLDREGVFYKDESTPTLEIGDRKEFRGSISIIEVELPQLSVNDIIGVMKDYSAHRQREAKREVSNRSFGKFDEYGYFPYQNPVKK